MAGCRGGCLKPGDRVPGTRFTDYLKLAPLLWTRGDKPVGAVIGCSGPLYDRLLHPLLLAALNTEPRDGSAALAGTIVRETIAAGGAACRPLVARDGLSGALVDPALAYLQARDVAIQFGHELHALRFQDRQVAALDFGDRYHRPRRRTTASSWPCRPIPPPASCPN